MTSIKHMLTATAIAGLFALTPVLLLAQNALPAQGDEKKLIGVLESDAPFFEKAKACQRLAVIGTRKSVPVLAGLLADEKLAHYARFALEPIPDPLVDETLRAATGKLEGKLLVGVINSIGVRRDAKALDGLKELLGAGDTGVAAAAAAALGRIGTPEAAEALKRALAGAAADLRPAIADACLPCAEVLLAHGKRDESVALYDAVRRAKLPRHIRLAALRGAILARGPAGVRLLARRLKAKDRASFAAALGVAREMPGSEVTRALVSQLSELTPERQAMVIGVMGVRGDKAALPAVLKAARSGSAEVRVAGIRVLRDLGDASAVPVLLEAAVQSTGDLSQVARATLATLRGDGVDDAIVAALRQGQGKLRPVLIEAVGQRRITSAVPALRKAADEEDEQIRLAAIKALGETIALDDLTVLTARLVDARTPAESTAVLEALKSAARRMPDTDACAEKLVASMRTAPVEAKCLLLEVFSSVGGTQALEAVSASARNSNEKIRDAATRVLGAWKTEDAASELLALVTAFENTKDRMRAFHAFSQLVRRLGFPKEERLGVCQKALEIARSDEERKVVLHTLAGIPAPETLSMLTPYLSNPTLKEAASVAAVTIAQRIVRSRRNAVAKAMKQVLAATENKDLARQARRLLRQAGGKP